MNFRRLCGFRSGEPAGCLICAALGEKRRRVLLAFLHLAEHSCFDPSKQLVKTGKQKRGAGSSDYEASRTTASLRQASVNTEPGAWAASPAGSELNIHSLLESRYPICFRLSKRELVRTGRLPRFSIPNTNQRSETGRPMFAGAGLWLAAWWDSRHAIAQMKWDAGAWEWPHQPQIAMVAWVFLFYLRMLAELFW